MQLTSMLKTEWLILFISVGYAHYTMSRTVAVNYFKKLNNVKKKFSPYEAIMMSGIALLSVFFAVWFSVDFSTKRIAPLITGEWPVIRVTLTEWEPATRYSPSYAVLYENKTDIKWVYDIDNVKTNTHVGQEMLIQHSETLGGAHALAIGTRNVEDMLRNGIPNNTDVKANIECLIRWSMVITTFCTLWVLYHCFKHHDEQIIKNKKIRFALLLSLLLFFWLNMYAITISSKSFETETGFDLLADVSHNLLILFFIMSAAYSLPWQKILKVYKYWWKHRYDLPRDGSY